MLFFNNCSAIQHVARGNLRGMKLPLPLIHRDVMYAGFAGAKTCHAPYLRPTGMWKVLEMQEQFPAIHVGKFRPTNIFVIQRGTLLIVAIPT